MRVRKRFGQHFLTDHSVLSHIVSTMHVGEKDCLLEIGPGGGALTNLLADAPAIYKAVEIDRDLIPFLQASHPRLDIISGDILRVDLNEIATVDQQWRVFGNLPYNISSPLIAKLTQFVTQYPDRVRDMHFMLQKEMADRLGAEPGTKAWGRLSVMVQLFFDIAPVCDVAPESFTPPPKVWSSVIRMIPTKREIEVDVAVLDRVLRTAFSARRKRLSNALKTLELDWSEVAVDPGARPDSLSADEYISIARVVQRMEAPI